MFSCDFTELSIDYMTEILSLRLYGTVCTQVIFSLSTLSVLHDNDAVVSAGRILLRQRRWECQAGPTTSHSLGLVAHSFQNRLSSRCLIHYQRLLKVWNQTPVRGWSCYFTNQVMSGLHLMYVGKVFVVSSVWFSMLNILYLRLGQ
uniref:Uncharacterized protein n=1 Tax=Cucumis melo TaxID=3656 RepID=A0A9I9E5P4_CUCME